MSIGLFCGTSKPNSLAEYLHDLVQELNNLKSGFLFKQKTFFLNVVSVVCDTPARVYHGCDKCHQTGVRKSNRMTIPEVNAERRTDYSFRQQQMKNTTSNTHLLLMLALTWSLVSHTIICTWFVWV